MTDRTYKIKYAYSSRDDIKEIKQYILRTFKYRELGENFTRKVKEAARSLKTMPAGYETTGIFYRGYDVYIKPYRTYLFFYVVDEDEKAVTILRGLQDGRNWRYIINRWIKENR